MQANTCKFFGTAELFLHICLVTALAGTLGYIKAIEDVPVFRSNNSQ